MTRFHRTVSQPRHTWASRLLFDRQAEFWLGELSPVRSLRAIRARVAGVIAETADTRTFVLAPNRHWRGHQAGQHTTVEVEIDGVRVRRCYSLSSAPGDARPAITVKRVPGGRVSGWLHDHVGPGHVVTLGPAAGAFVLPTPAPPRLLMLSGGSGVTPLMSMLRDLDARGDVGDVVFVHHARSRDDVIFGDALTRLAARHRRLRLVVRLDDEGGRFDEAALARLVPDFAARETFLCGPPGLMARVEAMWEDAGAGARLRREHFVAPALPRAPEGPGGGLVRVRLSGSGRTVEVAAGGSLLEALEGAGERPAHGCRIGICHTCRCRKRAGAVRNLRTGAVSSEPDQDIQLCISAPVSDLDLAL